MTSHRPIRRSSIGRLAGWPRVAASLAFWSLVALVTWLDADHCLPTTSAGVFYAVWAGIEALAGFIATAAELTVTYLGAVVSWLASRVSDILMSTGAMFARVWDVLKVFYGDVIKPAFVYLAQKFEDLRAWLTDALKPALDFLTTIRDEIRAIYNTFIRPVLDVIDIVRGGLKVLEDLGVSWAKALDLKLGELESAITENFLKVLGKVNQIIGVIDAVITGDLLFQRVPFLRTLKRDIGAVSRSLIAARTRVLTSTERAKLARSTETQPVPELADQLKTFLEGGHSDAGDVIAAATERGTAFLESLG